MCFDNSTIMALFLGVMVLVVVLFIAGLLWDGHKLREHYRRRGM